MSKKHKRRVAETGKPTSMSIGFRLPKNSNAAKASIRPDGTIVITDTQGKEIVPEYMEREVFYDRPSKPKVQTRWRLEAGLASVSGIPELARYESLFAIDTSTRTIDGERVSVACFFSFRLMPDGEKFVVEPEANLNFYEFRGVNGGNPEMLAILKVASDVAATAPVRAVDHRFAIVTDSELGAHDEISSRARPIYGNHWLPEQFTLIYASADTGHEFLKRLVRFCDRQAGVYFKEMVKGAITKPFEALPQDPTVRYRFLFRRGLEVVNPTVGGPSLAPGSTVTLYGRR
jgi:hypothetical protein